MVSHDKPIEGANQLDRLSRTRNNLLALGETLGITLVKIAAHQARVP